MKRILIVDDNKNNRLFLNALLEDFLEENTGVSIEVKEAANGKIAVDLAAEEKFDLILMDIMMPEMDGIEATRQIRNSDKNVMIIAVSAADDEERKKQILNNGAEDYIAKPVNADIFQTRLKNYFSLIEARDHKRFNEEAFNLFTREVYNRQTVFMIGSDDALAEFWEYYLLSELPKCDLLSDVIRTIAALAELFVRLGIPTRVIAEESEEKMYLTLDSINQLDRKLIELTLHKNSTVSEYEIGEDRMSFVVNKPSAAYTPAPDLMASPVLEPSAAAMEEPTVASENIEVMKSSEDLEIFNYMDMDDLEEIEAYIGKLDSLLLLVGSSDITEDEVTEIFTYLDRIGRMMVTYTETYAMGQSLSALANDIAEHIDVFRANSAGLGPLCAAFSHDLSRWMRMTFHDGSPSVHYMDDTVIANTQTIGSMLKMDDQPSDTESDLDDIFDF